MVGVTNLLEVLALELGDDLLETVTLGVNADGGEDGLDVGGGGSLVAGKGEEEVGSEVLHCELTDRKFCQLSFTNFKIECDRALKSASVDLKAHKRGTYRW